MERDFMGLNTGEQFVVVKEESIDSAKDSVMNSSNRGFAIDFVGFTKGSGSQWPFSNKASVHSHLMSFNGSQDEKPKRVAAAEPVDLGHKRGEGQNIAGAGFPKQQQFVGGVPLAAARSALPSSGSAAGFTNLWSNAKASGSPTQLTIFYGGTVNVFDDISPEKAQAIMFLAGSNASVASNAATHQRSQLMPPASKPVVNDGGVTANQTMNTPPPTALSSPLSVSSHTGAQSGSGSTGNTDLSQAMSLGVSAPHAPMVDTPKLINSLGPVSIAAMMQSAVPQARKASLARFLEKRKERMMNAAAPYDLSKKYLDCASPDMNGINTNVSASSGVGCRSL